MPARLLLTCIVSLVLIGLLRPVVQAAPDATPLLYTVAPAYDALAWLRGGERFPLGATIFLRNDKGEHPLVTGFAASADAAVSFDGERVLFAGKQQLQDPWEIWEVPVGGRPRRITAGGENCIRPFYLPENRIVYARKTEGRFVIEVMNLSGGKSAMLTYGVGNFLPDDVLRDGRILLEASDPSQPESTPEIYTVYSDGSGVESYRCDHGVSRHHARQVSSGEIVFPSGRGLAKFTSARAQQVTLPAPAGEYAGEIAENSDGDWIVPWRARADQPYRLVMWKPGASELRPAVAQRANVLQPVLLAERAVPNRHPSGLHDWPNANLLCLNAYTSKHAFAPGSIHSMRLYTRDSAGTLKLLGAAPVEPDGSFFVQVPSEQPLQIELLDTSGKTLHREAGFFWLRRGEQRECVGCHAGPESAPENAVPMILLKSTPADLTGTSAQNAAGGH